LSFSRLQIDNRDCLIDPHNRRLNYLRISVTDRCNLRCIYCMPYGAFAKLRHEDILTYEEILRLAGIALGLGVNKIRLTGGEPLLRKGIFDFLPELTALPGLEEVSLTTNGIFLSNNLEKIRVAGIKRINVSMDTLRRDRYKKITGYDGFEEAWEGIKRACQLGFHPVKINMVPIRGLNDDEIIDFARLSQDNPYHVRFIEYMPIGVKAPDNPMQLVPSSLLKEKITRLGRLVPVPRASHDGPAERFKFEGSLGEIGFISAMTHHFCHTCNRLRLTASGSLRSCLLSDHEEDLKGPMRKGASDNDLAQIFLKATSLKPFSHYLAAEHPLPLSGKMSSIGG
jgi:cyclic pyranopterin phosphate synthase